MTWQGQMNCNVRATTERIVPQNHASVGNLCRVNLDQRGVGDIAARRAISEEPKGRSPHQQVT